MKVIGFPGDIHVPDINLILNQREIHGCPGLSARGRCLDTKNHAGQS
jgi:hypothetical protein